jgi:hypothetical protein
VKNPSHKTYERRFKQTGRQLAKGAAIEALTKALRDVTEELAALHMHHYRGCAGGCPADVVLAEARRLLGVERGASPQVLPRPVRTYEVRQGQCGIEVSVNGFAYELQGSAATGLLVDLRRALEARASLDAPLEPFEAELGPDGQAALAAWVAAPSR